jgi:hypothetical protein
MLELCIRVKAENLHAASVLAPPVKKFTGIYFFFKLEYLIISSFKKKDLDLNHFWKWTDFNSYIQFICVFILIGSLITRLLINSVYFIEFLGNLQFK